MRHVRTDAVVVGDRARRNLGDLSALMASIRSIGLIYPIVIDRRNRLVVGERRLVAFQRLGRETIPAVVVDTVDDALSRLRVERDEDTERLPMVASERVALGRRIEELGRPNADEQRRIRGQFAGRLGGRGNRKDLVPGYGTLSGSRKKIDTREKAAEAAGLSTAMYSRIRQIHRAAAGQAPTDAVPITPEIQEHAEHAMDLIDRISVGEKVRDEEGRKLTVTTVYRMWRKIAITEPESRSEERKPDTSIKLRTPANAAISGTRQRKAVEAIVQQLGGINYAIANIDHLDPSITGDEASRWAADLASSARAIRRLKRLLEEHSKWH